MRHHCVSSAMAGAMSFLWIIQSMAFNRKFTTNCGRRGSSFVIVRSSLQSYLDSLSTTSHEYFSRLSPPPAMPAKTPTAPVHHLDAVGLAYLNEMSGSGRNAGSDGEPASRYTEMAAQQVGGRVDEATRLRDENRVLKKALMDVMSLLDEIAGVLDEVEEERTGLMTAARTLEEKLFKAADLFPDDDEVQSYKWLTKR